MSRLITTPCCVSGRLHCSTEGLGEGTNGGLEGEDREEVGKEVSIFNDLNAVEVSIVIITRVAVIPLTLLELCLAFSAVTSQHCCDARRPIASLHACRSRVPSAGLAHEV